MKLAWLFMRGSESIRVECDDTGPRLTVAGPGTERQRREFRDHIELAVFELELEYEERVDSADSHSPMSDASHQA